MRPELVGVVEMGYSGTVPPWMGWGISHHHSPVPK